MHSSVAHGFARNLMHFQVSSILLPRGPWRIRIGWIRSTLVAIVHVCVLQIGTPPLSFSRIRPEFSRINHEPHAPRDRIKSYPFERQWVGESWRVDKLRRKIVCQKKGRKEGFCKRYQIIIIYAGKLWSRHESDHNLVKIVNDLQILEETCECSNHVCEKHGIHL